MIIWGTGQRKSKVNFSSFAARIALRRFSVRVANVFGKLWFRIANQIRKYFPNLVRIAKYLIRSANRSANEKNDLVRPTLRGSRRDLCAAKSFSRIDFCEPNPFAMRIFFRRFPFCERIFFSEGNFCERTPSAPRNKMRIAGQIRTLFRKNNLWFSLSRSSFIILV